MQAGSSNHDDRNTPDHDSDEMDPQHSRLIKHERGSGRTSSLLGSRSRAARQQDADYNEAEQAVGGRAHNYNGKPYGSRYPPEAVAALQQLMRPDFDQIKDEAEAASGATANDDDDDVNADEDGVEALLALGASGHRHSEQDGGDDDDQQYDDEDDGQQDDVSMDDDEDNRSRGSRGYRGGAQNQDRSRSPFVVPRHHPRHMIQEGRPAGAPAPRVVYRPSPTAARSYSRSPARATAPRSQSTGGGQVRRQLKRPADGNHHWARSTPREVGNPVQGKPRYITYTAPRGRPMDLEEMKNRIASRVGDGADGKNNNNDDDDGDDGVDHEATEENTAGQEQHATPAAASAVNHEFLRNAWMLMQQARLQGAQAV